MITPLMSFTIVSTCPVYPQGRRSCPISSPSVNVVATASRYGEKRDERGVGFEGRHGKAMMGLACPKSDESDPAAQAGRIGISQDFSGDRSILRISHARGRDEVRGNGLLRLSGRKQDRRTTASISPMCRRTTGCWPSTAR